ncbi:hypothetical protein IQ255_14835 [Pleurocapsales cyanobacterium LEGE 10410]|nr:hypothetical protein [Pleurocapsales cyanobacterium LEGE 10410]
MANILYRVILNPIGKGHDRRSLSPPTPISFPTGGHQLSLFFQERLGEVGDFLKDTEIN